MAISVPGNPGSKKAPANRTEHASPGMTGSLSRWVHRDPRLPRRQTRGGRCAARGSLLCITWTSCLDRSLRAGTNRTGEETAEQSADHHRLLRCARLVPSSEPPVLFGREGFGLGGTAPSRANVIKRLMVRWYGRCILNYGTAVCVEEVTLGANSGPS